MRAREPKGNVANGSRVMRDVVADFAVPPGRRLDQQAILVRQGHGDSINLQLDHPSDRLPVQLLRHAFAVGPQFGDAVRVFDRQHRQAMADRGEAFKRLVAQSLRRTVGGAQFRMRILQGPQLG